MDLVRFPPPNPWGLGAKKNCVRKINLKFPAFFKISFEEHYSDVGEWDQFWHNAFSTLNHFCDPVRPMLALCTTVAGPSIP